MRIAGKEREDVGRVGDLGGLEMEGKEVGGRRWRGEESACGRGVGYGVHKGEYAIEIERWISKRDLLVDVSFSFAGFALESWERKLG